MRIVVKYPLPERWRQMQRIAIIALLAQNFGDDGGNRASQGSVGGIHRYVRRIFRGDEAMEEWVLRALKRWPNVPALYGWLKLDRRGRWLIQGETISRPQIIDVLDRNYAVDERGCWFFQNGPQRGYMQLERAPFIVHVEGDDLTTHNRLAVERIAAVYMDEEGGLYLQTEYGPAALLDSDLEWVLPRLHLRSGERADERALAAALAQPSGATTKLFLRFDENDLPIMRLDNEHAPRELRFVRDPAPTATLQ